MDTFIPILILLLLSFSCKKKEEIIKYEETNFTIHGIYEIYPSYQKKIIKFEDKNICKYYENDIIKNCYYRISQNYLKIYIENNLPEGIFYIDKTKQKIYRGLWNNEVRFLKAYQ
ncbi:MAG: hypothetical protein KatS3mg068_2699 [Candidatus Sericytochromatia bacterium]|nr:MAG: hypothetical protein KatS3mg068_2699 [Candidatus Sericytochromatia bacterium]GIX40873.1 MAG: hypothetical protein KatS3mg129_0606 [Leptospiraceae bacterium]